MSLTNEDIATIMRLLRESSFDKLELTDGELSLKICSAAAIRAERQGVASAAAETRPADAAPEVGARAPTENTPPGNAAAAGSGPASAAPSAALGSSAPQETAAVGGAEEDAAGGAGETAVVESPSVGVFYVAPEPGAPPFVSPGDHVGADDAVGLLEAMKTFTTVYAGKAGTVLEILAGNDTLVETGDPLIVLRPGQ